MSSAAYSQWDKCDVLVIEIVLQSSLQKEHLLFLVYKIQVLPQGNVWHIDTILFPWQCMTDLLFVFIRVFWCSPIYCSLLTTALYSVEFNWVTRCFTSFFVQAETASGSSLSEVTVNEEMLLSAFVCIHVLFVKPQRTNPIKFGRGG